MIFHEAVALAEIDCFEDQVTYDDYLACFRPALVGNVRLGSTWRFTWEGDPMPSVALETAR